MGMKMLKYPGGFWLIKDVRLRASRSGVPIEMVCYRRRFGTNVTSRESGREQDVYQNCEMCLRH